MSNSTQNDEIGKMEKAIDEGFAESEKFLKGMKTPFDKYSTQNNHETHTACIEIIKKEGASATCCHCNPHDGCTLEMKPTQNDWEKKHDFKYYLNQARFITLMGEENLGTWDIEDLNKLLADARREAIADLFSNQDFLNNLKWIIQDHMNRAFKDFNEDYFIPGEMRDVGVVADRTVEAFLATLREEEKW